MTKHDDPPAIRITDGMASKDFDGDWCVGLAGPDSEVRLLSEHPFKGLDRDTLNTLLAAARDEMVARNRARQEERGE